MPVSMRSVACAAVLCLGLAACGGSGGYHGDYYMVRDPATGNTYYTRDVEKAGETGAVRFQDNVTGSIVTLQTSEVKQVSRREYRNYVPH